MVMHTIGAESFTGVLASALERMAFVICDPCDETPGEVMAKSIAHAVVGATGPVAVKLCVSATAGLVGEVASGMLGIDSEDLDVDEHARAVVTELANIFGGELVMKMTEGEEGMVLSLPQEVGDDEAGALLDRVDAGGFAICLGTDTGQLLVTVVRG